MKPTFSLVVLMLVSTLAVGDEDRKSKNERDPWNGFAVGSWIIRVGSLTVDGKDEIKKEKLTREADDKEGRIQLKGEKEGKKQGVFDGGNSTHWHIPGYDIALDPKAKLLDTATEDLKIKDKTYACEVKLYELSGDNYTAAVTFWHCKDKDVRVPYRELGVDPRSFAMRPDVLKIKVVYTSKGMTETTTLQVVDFQVEHKIGERKITCVREEGIDSMIDGEKKANGEVVRLLSNEVPGREVSIIHEGEYDGKKGKRENRIEAFEVVKGK